MCLFRELIDDDLCPLLQCADPLDEPSTNQGLTLTISQSGDLAIRSSGSPDFRMVWETMAKNFRIISYSREGKITQELSGEIDGSSAAEVCWELQQLGIRECSLDFSRVEVIDLFGARVLARGLRALREQGVRFEVEGLPERVAENLCLGGVLEAIV